MKSEYEDVTEEMFALYANTDGNFYLKLACCDCGLVHDHVYMTDGKKYMGIIIERNERSTGQLRRHSTKPTVDDCQELLSAAKSIIQSLCLKIPDSDYCGSQKWLQDYKKLAKTDPDKP